MVRRHHDCALRQPEDSARALISDHSPRRGSRHLATAPALDAHSAAGILHDASLSLASNDDQASVAQALGRDNASLS